MTTILLQQMRPINRKQRLLDYLKNQENKTLVTKANEHEIEEEIESVFEELVADTDDAIYITEMEIEEEFHTEKADDDDPKLRGQYQIQIPNSPIVKKSKPSKSDIAKELEKYSEKFDSVVETANILHQQLQDVTKNGVILCEDTDVSYDGVTAIIQRELSPTPQNKKKQRETKKPVKRILHITGDSTLEYFEDCETIGDVEALEYTENSPVQEKTNKRCIVSKKSLKEFVHITGDSSSPKDFGSKESPSKYSSNPSETNEFSPTKSISFPYVSHTNPENMIIGPNDTFVNKDDFKNIDWALSAPIVTRKLLLYIFGRDILSTHSLTGKPSPAFLDQKKPLKKPLDPKKVADIIYIVTKKKNVKAKEVRLTITSKCADEQKMRKTRMSK